MFFKRWKKVATLALKTCWRNRTVGVIALCCLSLFACSRGDQLSATALPTPSKLSSSEGVVASLSTVSLSERWVVSGTEAADLIAQGATVLDARGRWVRRPFPGAIQVRWQDFSPTRAEMRGTLLDDEQLGAQLRSLGVSNNKPVVVFGNLPGGWGEEGRIVWMLRSLGHTQAVMVDGGVEALRATDVVVPTVAPTLGDFVVKRDSRWSIEKEELRSQLNSDNLVIIDTREPREFNGATPYGEQRGGHIPGAISLYFKTLLDNEGKLLPEQALLEQFASLGLTSDKTIVVYCTGGIRSGWLAAVLVSMGFDAKNYAGSMWEWSAASADSYPLERN